MLSGKAITMLDALSVSLASILVVFAVLFILYVSVSLYPFFFRAGKEPEKKASAVPEAPEPEDEGEILAVIAAAVRAYEGGRKHGGTFLARGRKG